jgi:hypothetical protein
MKMPRRLKPSERCYGDSKRCGWMVCFVSLTGLPPDHFSLKHIKVRRIEQQGKVPEKRRSSEAFSSVSGNKEVEAAATRNAPARTGACTKLVTRDHEKPRHHQGATKKRRRGLFFFDHMSRICGL